MKIEIDILYDPCGYKYLQQKKEMVEISNGNKHIIIEYNGEQLQIPQEAFIGLSNEI